jgi:hypothetical protein
LVQNRFVRGVLESNTAEEVIWLLLDTIECPEMMRYLLEILHGMIGLPLQTMRRIRLWQKTSFT